MYPNPKSQTILRNFLWSHKQKGSLTRVTLFQRQGNIWFSFELICFHTFTELLTKMRGRTEQIHFNLYLPQAFSHMMCLYYANLSSKSSSPSLTSLQSIAECFPQDRSLLRSFMVVRWSLASQILLFPFLIFETDLLTWWSDTAMGHGPKK